MPEETPAEESASGGVPAVEESTTPGGYSYTVVEDASDNAADVVRTADPPTQQRRAGVPLLATAALVIVVAVVTGVLVWFFNPSSGGDDAEARLGADVANVLNIFRQQTGTVTTRYEGELPSGYPADLPVHDQAHLVSSIAEVSGEDVSYFVIWDTEDPRDRVAAGYQEKFSADPWQIDVTQDGRESTLHQFSKIDDPDVAGVVLLVDSKSGTSTTIITNVQVTSGGKNVQATPFVAGPGRALPAGFPGDIPAYDGATLIESSYQQAPGAKGYVASYITQDGASGVLEFYRSKLRESALTVEDADASQSALVDAEAIQFVDAAQTLRGGVTVGKFAEDATYTRIDVTVQVTKE